jgi:hypothetical protein
MRRMNQTRGRKSGRKLSRKSTTQAMTGSGAKEMAVMKNAFSSATNAPRIPDGKEAMSTGQRFQAIREFQMAEGKSAMTFNLFGALGAGAHVQNAKGTVGQLFDTTLFYNNHGTLTNRNSATEWSQTEGQEINKWRLVSQAIKLVLVNNSDENDGWWEAIRIPVDNDAGDWMQMVGTTSVTDGSSAVAEPLSVLMPKRQVIDYDFVSHPTYMSGKLKDIHKMTFQLNSTSGSHEFTKMKKKFVLDNETRLSDATGLFSTDTTDVSAFVDQAMDMQFDRLVIRINGRTGTSAAAGTGTRILAHVISNQEVIYEPGTFATRFHAPTNGRKRGSVPRGAMIK